MKKVTTNTGLALVGKNSRGTQALKQNIARGVRSWLSIGGIGVIAPLKIGRNFG